MHHQSAFVGAAMGVASMAVPDGIASFAVKVLTGVAVGVLSALATELVKRFFRRK